MRPPQGSTPADEVNKLGGFDAEIHMRTSVSPLAKLMVRIHSPPAGVGETYAKSPRRCFAAGEGWITLRGFLWAIC